MTPITADAIQTVESYLACGQVAEAQPLVAELVASMEAYIDENCVTTDEVQYFSFASQFQKIAYQRVENDPRTLVAAPAAFDRVYADYAFCLLSLNDPEAAAEALKKAVRWNPMECAHRLDLAAVLNSLGDDDEYLKLSYSVFARASKSAHLVRAFLNFSQAFESAGEWEAAAACAKAAWRMNDSDARVVEVCERLAVQGECGDPRKMPDDRCSEVLDEQGLPDGANVVVVLSALLLAEILSAGEDEDAAAEMTWIAIDLAGQENAKALAQIVREQA